MSDIWKRFWTKVTVRTPDECWEWQANLGRGYGMFWFGKVPVVAHRLSWMMLRGDIPENMLVLHKCDNRKCVNPNHLFIGTSSDNALDKVRKGRAGYSGHDAKVFTDQEKEIVSVAIQARRSLRSIARDFNTTHGTIRRAILDGRISIKQ